MLDGVPQLIANWKIWKIILSVSEPFCHDSSHVVYCKHINDSSCRYRIWRWPPLQITDSWHNIVFEIQSLTENSDLWLLQKRLLQSDWDVCCLSDFYKRQQKAAVTQVTSSSNSNFAVNIQSEGKCKVTHYCIAMPQTIFHLVFVFLTWHWGRWVLFLDCRVSAYILSPSTFSSREQSRKTTGHPIFV